MSIHWRTLDGQGKVEAIKSVWHKGISASQIASYIEGTSRNAIIGVYNRYPGKLLDAPLQGKYCPPLDGRAKNTPRPVPDRRVVVNKPSKPLKPVEVYVEEQQLVGKPLTMLQARQCKWPVNDAARGEQHLFCGLGVAHGPYCAHHVRRAAPQVRA